MKRRTLLKTGAAAMVFPTLPARASDDPAAIAHDAFIYAYPMVENYLSLHQYALDPGNSQYKGPMNAVHNVARVFTPEDTGVVTPNSDTPYSFLVLDLRLEPVVVTMPEIAEGRYYSAQLVDLYTHNVDYLGTRVDGNGGGNFLITRPGWTGDTPEGITRVIEMPTSIAFVMFRTQLFNPADIDQVKAVQAGYHAQPLSRFAGTPVPLIATIDDWPPISRETMVPEFWSLANYLLQFSPPLPWEADLRASFEMIGLRPGAQWPPADMPAETAKAIQAAGEAAFKEIQANVMTITSSTGLFGSPEDMKGEYMQRAMGAAGGLYGNSEQEAIYPSYLVDATGLPLDTSKHDYAFRFKPDNLPPVDAFWSITMYDGETRFLIDNPLDRYLINSAMLPDLVADENGEIVIYLQKDSPGPDKEANWLPAPDGPMASVLRLYLPQAPALDGRWTPPAIETLN